MANLRFIQSGSFSIGASGASAGDTTLTVQSFKQIDGLTNIVTADLGDLCYGTLEPNNGTQEEAISFTGVTQNANGTATLTGVKTVGFSYPYTTTSGLAKSHAGGVTFILSNDAGFYGNIKSYIDTVALQGAPMATNTTPGITFLSVAAANAASAIAVGDNDSRIPTQTQTNYLSTIVNTAIPYAVGAGTSSAFTATVASAISSLASGTHLNLVAPVTNASGVTLNVNSLGAKTVKKNFSNTLASGDVVAGQVMSVVYDGTSFQLTSPTSSSVFSKVKTGITSHTMSSSTTQNIAHGLGSIPKYVRVQHTYINTNSTALGFYDGTTQTAYGYIIDARDGSNNITHVESSSFIVWSGYNSFGGTNANTTGTITFDGTNIIIAWSPSGSPSGTSQLIWEAYA